MAAWKMPPKAKVYEALSACLDGRVRLVDEGTAEVSSSGGDKVYKVKWTSSTITSSDPATRFQGYLGYPVIAVMLQRGLLSYDPEIAAPLKGVPWKTLNGRFKRDYDKAVEHVLSERQVNEAPIKAMVDDIFRQLEALGLEKP